MNARPFLFHVQKTAGTTIRTRLELEYGQDRVFPDLDRRRAEDPGHGLESYVELAFLESFGSLDRFAAFVGHFPYSIRAALPFEVVAVTALRDPVDRAVSMVSHLRRVMSRAARAEVSLERIYDDPVIRRGMLGNFQTRMFGVGLELVRDAESRPKPVSGSGDPAHMQELQQTDPIEAQMEVVRRMMLQAPFANAAMFTPVIEDEALLDRAMDALRSVELVGVQSDVNGLLARCGSRFGWREGTVEPANVDPRPPTVAASFRMRIAADSALDVALYELAGELSSV